MNEALKSQPLLWGNLECVISKINGTEVVTMATDDEIQRKATDRIVARAQEAVAEVEKLGIFDPLITLTPFTLRVAVLPREKFEPVLFEGLENPQDWAWAQVCVRKIGEHYFVVYDSSIATSEWESNLTMPVDQWRETNHEVGHLWYKNGLKDGMRDETATKNISHYDMVVELIPRISLGIQKRMPDSTEFLLGLCEDQVLPIGTIDERGWGCFPAKPLKENPMYGAIFLAGLATVDILGGGNLEQGTRNMIRLAQGCENFGKFYDRLSESDVKKDWLLKSLESIRKGQEILRANFSA